jgi:hypothetical protein
MSTPLLLLVLLGDCAHELTVQMGCRCTASPRVQGGPLLVPHKGSPGRYTDLCDNMNGSLAVSCDNLLGITRELRRLAGTAHHMARHPTAAEDMARQLAPYLMHLGPA